MHRIRADPFCNLDNLRDVEIGGHGRGPIDGHNLIRDGMGWPLLLGCMAQHGGREAAFLGGAQDARRDLAAIGDQKF
ncbi:hypothetical protein LRS09_27485 [Mesorhizobium sp. J428]|nr:hypothetical protein [Mesorhizobium sp. J428]MCR5860269.1 hypothetical protein [Mesorhizobium sp. J428]